MTSRSLFSLKKVSEILLLFCYKINSEGALARKEYFMTFQEQTELLMTAIQSLMALYRDITEIDRPFVRVSFSELKKTRVITCGRRRPECPSGFARLHRRAGKKKSRPFGISERAE